MPNPVLIIPGAGEGDGANIVDVIKSLGRDALALHDTDTPWVDAATISDFIVANGLTGCHLIGCSLGGVTAVEYAKHRSAAPFLTATIATLDSPLFKTQQDGYFRLVYALSLGKSGWLWSGSPFMKALRNDALPASLPVTQWMNDYQDGVGGFLEQVLPNAPAPHFNQQHISLYTDAAVWTRVLGGLS